MFSTIFLMLTALDVIFSVCRYLVRLLVDVIFYIFNMKGIIRISLNII